MTAARALLVSLRPHQWTKNLVVFAPLALSKHLFEGEAFGRAALAFILFCGLSGAVYLVNDLADLERDRRHPLKRSRPLASGALAPRSAALFAAVLTLVCLGLGTLLDGPFVLCALLYLLLNLAYSLGLKGVVILDVIAISLGFVLRAVGGALAIAVRFSDWLLVCTILLALFLALAKRRHELTSLNDAAPDHRPILAEYSPYLLDQMISVVTASCLMAYAFYCMAPDRPLLLDVALWALTIIVIVYTAGGAPVPRGR